MKHKSCWPTLQQELLLQAALCKKEKAITAWRKWQEIVDIDDIDYGSLRLIPLLYNNLANYHVKSPIMRRYRGIYQNFWAKNQLLFHNVKPILAALYQEGIEMMLYKGAGLIFAFDIAAGLRPMDDFDLIIRMEDVQKVIRITEKLKWVHKFDLPLIINDTTHEVSLKNNRGQFIDIHLHAQFYAKWGKHEMRYWERASSIDFYGIPVKVMDNTSHLINIIIHGVAWNTVSPIRWIPDSMMLIKNTLRNIQWDYLIKQSKELHATLPVCQGLKYLKEKLYAPVPGYVLLALNNAHISSMEKLTYKLIAEPPLPQPLNGMSLKFLTYFVYRPNYPFPGILRYFQDVWGLDSPWEVPLQSVQRFFKNIFTNITEYIEAKKKLISDK